jgi:hypothetical protein
VLVNATERETVTHLVLLLQFSREKLGTRFLYYTAIYLPVPVYAPVIQLACPRYAQMVTWTVVEEWDLNPFISNSSLKLIVSY